MTRRRWWIHPRSRVWHQVRAQAAALNADGCSGVPDFYLDACLYHDILYRTHRDLDSVTPVFKSEADARFREAMQSRSRFGRLSPMAWWRWAGVALFGRRAWEGKTGCHDGPAVG